MTFTDYIHTSTNNVWRHTDEMHKDNPIMIAFQESENPEDLGFTYICNYSEILQRIHDANEE